MQNFSLGKQLDLEIRDFERTKIQIAQPKNNDTVRFGIKKNSGYYFNQEQTLTLIDLYDNSQFENGQKDKEGNQRIFMNVGKFRRAVASKQVDIDTKEFHFFADPYADPWTAFFMQKDFHEWVKDTDFPALVNQTIENLPKYGTVVLKKRGKNLDFVHLQTLKNQQDARSLKEASYVIETHEDMEFWEIMAMPDWKKDGLPLKFGEKLTPLERYGMVPLSWYKKQKGLEVVAGDDFKTVYVMAIAARVDKCTLAQDGWWTFYVEKTECPYRELHWSRQYGRWLGIGVVEDLIPDQIAKNIVVNLQRKSLQWAAKRVFQSTTTDMIGFNLVKDVPDGGILEVGANGQISRVDLGSRDAAEFSQFLGEWEKSSDQRAFTYEASLMNMGGGATSFRIGALLTQVAQAYFDLKKENVGIFFKEVLVEFKIPQFIKDMGDAERNVAMFSDEPGFNALQAAAIQYVKSQAIEISLMSGKPVDASTIVDATSPFMLARSLLFQLSEKAYANAKYKFDFTITGEEVDIKAKVESLQMLGQMWQQTGDPRAEAVFARIAALGGEDASTFGPKPQARPAPGADGGAGASNATPAVPPNPRLVNAR